MKLYEILSTLPNQSDLVLLSMSYCCINRVTTNFGILKYKLMDTFFIVLKTLHIYTFKILEKLSIIFNFFHLFDKTNYL